jgi:4-hydroxyphenylpyruvate dioxygenase-like putative hemolysin
MSAIATAETVLLRPNHIVIATPDRDKTAADWEKYLGAKPRNFGEGSVLRMKRCQIDVGESYFAICEPQDEQSIFYPFVQKRGEAIYAMSFDVADFDNVIARMNEAGTRFSGDADTAWIHPKHTHGVNLGLHRESEHTPTEESRFKQFQFVVIAVNDRDAAAKDWETFIGVKGKKFLDLEDQGMRRMQFDVANGMWLALVEPLGEHSYQRKFLAEHPEGTYMISVKVDDPKETAKEMKSRGAEIIGDLDGDGPFYVHPRTTHGVLLGLSA